MDRPWEADQTFGVEDHPLGEGLSFVEEGHLMEVDHPQEGAQRSPCSSQEVVQLIPPFLVPHLLPFLSTHCLCL